MISEHNNKRFGVLRMLVTAPFIYAVFVPLFVLDVFITIYQWVAFPFYNIPSVDRRKYINFNRGKMESLNVIDRFNCHYCSYANGVISYARKIAAETERMWCPIRHKAKKGAFVEPTHHKSFVIRSKKKELESYYKKYELQMEQEAEDAGEAPSGVPTRD